MTIIALKGRPQFVVSRDHSRVFVQQTMVELGEQMNGSDMGKVHQVQKIFIRWLERMMMEETSSFKVKAALAQHLGPEIARETHIEQQVKIME